MIVSKYKVNVLMDKKIYVFYGYYHSSLEDLNRKFTKNPRDIVFDKAYNNSTKFEPVGLIFSEEELTYIRENEINVFFIDSGTASVSF